MSWNLSPDLHNVGEVRDDVLYCITFGAISPQIHPR